jgi:hypothetical protein
MVWNLEGKFTSSSNWKNICGYGEVDQSAVLLITHMEKLFCSGHSTFGIVCVTFQLQTQPQPQLHVPCWTSYPAHTDVILSKSVISNFQVTVCNTFILLIHYCSNLYVNLISVNLYELKTYHEVIDEIYYKVTHLEPWEKGSRKTAGQTGMCGGVSAIVTHF